MYLCFCFSQIETFTLLLSYLLVSLLQKIIPFWLQVILLLQFKFCFDTLKRDLTLACMFEQKELKQYQLLPLTTVKGTDHFMNVEEP